MQKDDRVKIVKTIADVLGVKISDVVGKKSVYILLDRSGSMSTLWTEAISSINNYLEGLDKDVNVYLAAFDSQSFDVLREGPITNVKKLEVSELGPRGGTPLYDSVAKVIGKMMADAPSRAVFISMTDGEENMSKEFSIDRVRSMIKEVEAKDWGVVYLGADFKNVELYATTTFGLADSTVLCSTRGNLYNTMGLASTKTDSYFKSGNVSALNWTDQEKEDASS
jgi:hypothetical protein